MKHSVLLQLIFIISILAINIKLPAENNLVDPSANDRSRTMLMEYAYKGNLKGVQKLLKDAKKNPKIQINQQDNWGYSALMDACSQGNFAIAVMLINNGADVNLKSKNGFTALMGAVSENNYELVKLLLDNNANRDVAINGITPLMEAQSQKNIKMVELLQSKK